MRRPIRLPLCLVFCATLLAACQSDEERAEEYFESALAYIEAGDADRARIELRNVFDNDGFHREARRVYADLLIAQGEAGQAYSQLLRLAEQYPEDLQARTTLAQMAVARNDWEEVRRHGEIAMSLAPQAEASRAVEAALKYRDGLADRDPAARADAVALARDVLAEAPGSMIARRVLITDAMEGDRIEEALAEIDGALGIESDSLELNMRKAQLLERLERSDELGAQLKHMSALFPGDERIAEALGGWYIAERDFAGAEAFLREQAGAADSDTEGHLALVRFLRRVSGPDAARAELKGLLDATEGSTAADLYRATLAALDFEAGRHDPAIASIEEILKNAAPSDQTRRIKIMQARMLAETGNEVGARARIEEVLAEDGSNVEALEMRAARLIAEDAPGRAIADLRTALDQAPRDTSILAMMAEAHLRDGSPELAQERLALAVQISDGAAADANRYARFLLDRGRPRLATTVLTGIARPTLRTSRLLAEAHLKVGDLAAAERLADRLRDTGSADATALAQSLRSAILFRQDRVDESLAYLRESIGDRDDPGAILKIVRAQIAARRFDEARAYLADRLAADPDNEGLRRLDARLNAMILAISGETTAAEAAYREILAAAPGDVDVAIQLQTLLRAEGDGAAADRVVAAAAARVPDAPRLQLLEAGRLERAGDYAGAIAIYERLYTRDSGNPVVANNLASLLSTAQQTDSESLRRAYAIARRFNGSDVAPFRDTLGWIRHLRGDSERAIADLEMAARGLPEEPSVAFHLGLAYAAVGRNEAARAEIERGLELAGDRDVLQKEEASAALRNI